MIKKFEEYQKIKEEAAATTAVSGMGAVVTASPGSIPGAAFTGNGTTGSGDIGVPLFKPFEKTPAPLINNFTNFASKRKKRKIFKNRKKS